MNNFFTRALTAVVYVGLIFGSLYAGVESFGLLCAFILLLLVDEYVKLLKRMKIRVNGTALQLVSIGCFGLVVLNRMWQVNVKYLAVLPILLLVLMVIEFLRDVKNPAPGVFASVFGVIYLMMPMSCLFILGFYESYSLGSGFHHHFLIGFFLLIWANDTGAYLLGSVLGKTKLIERISPKKTVEGSMGGLLLTMFGAWVVSLFAIEISLLDWVVVAILIVVFGSLGDLFESLLKRKAEVKDSGRIIPGHGGMLDRFDSVLFAAPATFSYLALIAH